MTRNVAYLLKASCVLLAAYIAVSIVALATGVLAFADEENAGDSSEDLNLTALELQLEIEDRQAAYASAREEADAAAASIEEARGRIAELEAKIPEQQERSAKAAREQYKFQQQGAGIIDLLLSADDFYSFISELEYFTYISDANAAEMARLSQLKDEIVAEQGNLEQAQRDAEAKADEARSAMESAQEAQAEVQRRIEEEARQQAEIAAAAAALAEEPRDNDVGVVEQSTPEDTSNGDDDTSSTGDSNDAGDSSEADDPTDSGAVPAPNDSLDSWTQRIDAYLAGSPLAGQGATFAAAALEYGVDPRLSPAISYTESSKGLYCFKSHNAWGWGSSSWDSWEEAIYAHVGGLARGYGGQLTIEGAKKYCPPNWKNWYNRTLEQMNMI